MIEEQARVVEVEGDLAEIVAGQHAACGSCSASAGCGTSLLAQWLAPRRANLRLRNDIGARPGDTVTLGIDEGQLRRSALRLYLLPLTGLILGAVLGERLFATVTWPPELGAVGLGLLGLIGALRLVGRRAGRVEGAVRMLRVAMPAAGIVVRASVPGAGPSTRESRTQE